MESHKAGFPPFPHSLEIPAEFPHSHGLDDWIYGFSYPLNSNHRHRKGLVTDVSGPQRNACPGTLIIFRASLVQTACGALHCIPGREAGTMAFHAFHTLSFPWPAFGGAE
jgi:hypothetical protein